MRVSRRVWGNGALGVATPGSADLPDRAWKLFDNVNSKIEHADVKAAAILGGCGVAVAALIGLMVGREARNTLLLACAGTTGIFSLISAAFCCGVLWPRRLQGRLPESLIYFDHLARTSNPAEIYEQLRLLLEDPEALSAEVIKQVLATSRVASKKYDLLNRALLFFFGALVCLGATAFVFVLHRNGH